jgi:ATP-binding protein involved in chromosome partitioning
VCVLRLMEVHVVNEQSVREALRDVLDPEIGKPIEDLGMLKGIEVDGSNVRVFVLLTIPGCPLKDRIERDVTAAVLPIEGVQTVEVVLGEMTGEQREGLVQQLRGGRPMETSYFTDGHTEVVSVASGKGGVGKSSVTANLAVALAGEGHQVGIVDADVWGFSIPRMMGVGGRPVAFNNMILPLESHGVKIMSMGFFVSDETPVIWRGPMLHKAVQQFLGDVYWGELDFLFVDLPPGTGDVSLSLASFLPGSSMLVVTTPQDAARKVAERAGRMAQHPNVKMKILGVIENMAGFVCPHCGEITDVFGRGGGEQTAMALEAPFLGAVPMQISLREGSDVGTPIAVSEPDSPAGAAFREIARELARKGKSLVGKSLPLAPV